MFKHRPQRGAALGLLTAFAVAGAGLLAAPAANAAATGTLGTSTSTGFSDSAFSVIAGAACSGGPKVQVLVTGGTGTNAFPAAGAGASPISNQTLYTTDPTTGGLVIPLQNTMDGLAAANGITIQPGKYTFDIICRPALGATVFDDFQGSIWFTTAHVWQNTDPNASTPTTTTVAPSVASPITAGTPVTFTATEAPSASGTVQFTDNGANLGGPVTVSGGKAASTAPNLAAGTHSVVAVFTPTAGNGFAGSSSQPLAYVVNAAQQTPTTTSLATNPSGTVAQNTPVTLTAGVGPATAAGKVQFSDNGVAIGAPVTVAAGAATLTTSTLGVGAHSFSASFTATDSAVFGNSVSGQIPLAVTAPTAPTATETITTTVLAGALVISVPDGQVTLPSPVLNNSGDLFTTSGALKPVTVTDNRAGNPGWTVNGQVSDFSDGGTHAINGQNLGWTPNVVDHSGAQTITLGVVVAPANGVAANDTGANGLKGSHALAIAGAGAGLGTAHLAAALDLNVPTTTVAGTYVATLTLTAI